ncbi:ssl1498 family light-harvesting-like protein [Spirulina major CS-329]|uniref:photosystem II assembly protein Psb34 n=1 Tax=Spirulina TaxID=1154 RepID=UPI00232E819B|nr:MULTISPECIES: ssl1498 family light-harvesting-like protein [Spirulina]MDB9495769.1 ssl1498 family light-harvesting-like protein [Spirulina subsalsa CS-330]MDB9503217.1 ssl1498 family light-harvesting-like protein [Spirulina major CS-329]
MRTTQLDNGILNNHAIEPDVYCAAYPTAHEQESYKIQAAWAVLFLASLLFMATTVTSLV